MQRIFIDITEGLHYVMLVCPKNWLQFVPFIVIRASMAFLKTPLPSLNLYFASNFTDNFKYEVLVEFRRKNFTGNKFNYFSEIVAEKHSSRKHWN